MNKITNADKQARFRKKEQLRRKADSLFKKWQRTPQKWYSHKPQEVQSVLDKIVELPPGWTPEDYTHAETKLDQYYMELFSSSDHIANDIDEAMNFHNEFKTTPDPRKLMDDNKAAVERARALSAHIISALELSNCSAAEQATALVEAMRFAALALVNSQEVPRSRATAMCLATIGPQYERPYWFPEKFANTVAWQIGKELAHELGRNLSEFDYKVDMP